MDGGSADRIAGHDPGVSLNPGRTGLLDVMTAMGATVEVIVTGDILGDPVGTVTVEGPVQHGMRIEGSSWCARSTSRRWSACWAR